MINKENIEYIPIRIAKPPKQELSTFNEENTFKLNDNPVQIDQSVRDGIVDYCVKEFYNYYKGKPYENK